MNKMKVTVQLTTEESLFIVQVKVTQHIQGFNEPQDIRHLKRGDFFGEKALLRLIVSINRHN